MLFSVLKYIFSNDVLGFRMLQVYDKICTDHSHYSGKIRGRAHNACNLKLKEQHFLPILCSNLSEFDGRMIMTAVGKYGAKNVSVIPYNSNDTYLSITVSRCRYLDSKRFLNASLEKLVQSMVSECGPASFKYLRQFVQEEDLSLFLQKQVLCNEYLDCSERLNECTLPDKAAFYDPINETDISDEQYNQIQSVWNKMETKTLKEYARTCLFTDVLLMSDVTSMFRQTLMTEFKLDPMQYYTLSGYSWDCALRKSQVELELITDHEMYLMIETSLRGGVATLGTPRYAKANQPTMPDYDPNSERSSLLFLDFCGLYTSIMGSSCLPTHNFSFLSDWEIDRLDILSIDDDSDKGRWRLKEREHDTAQRMI